MYETSQPVNTNNVYNNGVSGNEDTYDSHAMNESEFIDNPHEKEIDGMSEESEAGSHANADESEDVNEEETDDTETDQRTNYIPNEFEANSFQYTNQQIRRRPIHIHQQLRELSSSNNTNERPNVAKYKLSYIYIISGLIFVSAFFYLQYSNNSSFFQKLFDTTNNSSEEGVNTYTIGNHLYKLGENLKGEGDKLDVTFELCKDGKADKVEASIRSLDPIILHHFHSFDKEIMVASEHLHDMYSKRKEVYKKFEIEIEEMTSRLNSNDKGDAKYFKDRLNELIVIIEKFKGLMKETQDSIRKVGSIGIDIENRIHTKVKDRENLTAIHGYYYCLPNDDAKAKKEQEAIYNILDHLNKTAGHLVNIENFLEDYKNSLEIVSIELGDTGKGDDGMFEVTKIAGFERLKVVLSNI